MAQNNFKIPVSIELNQKEITASKQMIDKLLAFDIKMPEGITSALKDISGSYQVLFDKMGNRVATGLPFTTKDTKLLDTFNREIKSLDRNLSNLLQTATRELKLDVNTPEIAVFDAQLEGINNRLKELQNYQDDLNSRHTQLLSPGQLTKDTIHDNLSNKKLRVFDSEDYKDIKTLEEAAKKVESKIQDLEARQKTLQSKAKPTETDAKNLNSINDKIQALKTTLPTLIQAQSEIQAVTTEISGLQAQIEQLNAMSLKVQGEKDAALFNLGNDSPEAQAKILAEQRIAQLETNRILADAAATTDKVALANQNLIDSAGGAKEPVEDLDGAIVKGVKSFIKYDLIINQLKQTFRETWSTIKELDAAFNGMAIVIGTSTKDVWQMYGAFEKLAKQTGFTTKEVSKIALEYFRQGKAMSEVIQLTEAAAMAAKIAGISAEESVRYLTSAVNGYKMSADQAMEVSDKFAVLAAESATDYDGLAVALSKVASQAYTVGVNMDVMMGFIAKALETTQEAPENIGTAFKTIFARMSEIKDYGATLEDGMDLSRVDKALKSIGVALLTPNRELRNLDEVLIEVGKSWSTLTKNQKAYVTAALAGTRQQTRLLAVFEDFDRTMELVDASASSLGATYAQQAIYTESLEFAMNKVNVAWEGFTTSVLSSDLFIFFAQQLAEVIEAFDRFNSTLKGVPAILTLIGVAVLVVGKSVTKFKLEIMKTIPTMEGATISTGMFIKSLVGIVPSATAATGAVGGLTTGIKGLDAAIKFLNAHPVIALLSATALLVGGLIALSAASEKSQDRLNELEEEVRSLQATLYNVGKNESNLDKLVNEYEELDNKVVKTNEDLQRMEEILNSLSDLDSGINFTGLDGKLDAKAVEDYRDSIKESGEEALEDLRAKYTAILKEYNNNEINAFSRADSASRETIKLMEAMSLAKAETYEEWSELNEETKKHYLLLAQGMLKTKNIAKSEADFANYTTGTETAVTDEEKYQKHLETVKQANAELEKTGALYLKIRASEEYMNGTLAEQIQLLNENRLFAGENSQQLLSNIDSQYKVILDFVRNMGSVSNAANISSFWSVDKMVELESSLRNVGIETNKIRSVLQGALLSDSYEDAMNELLGNHNQYNITIEESMKLIDVFNTLRLGDNLSQDIENMAITLGSMKDRFKELNDNLTSGGRINIEMLNELAEQYPEIWESIDQTGYVTETVIDGIIAKNKELLDSKIKARIEELKIEKGKVDDQIDIITSFLDDESALYALSNQQHILGQVNVYEQLLRLQREYGDKRLRYEQYLKSKELIIQQGFSDEVQAKELNALDKKYGDIFGYEYQNLSDVGNQVDASDKAAIDKVKQQLEETRKDLEKRRGQLQAQINVLSKESFQSGIIASEKASKEVKEYEATLIDLYNTQAKIAHLNNRLEENQELQELTDNEQEYLKLVREELELMNTLDKEYANNDRLLRMQQARMTADIETYSKYIKLDAITGKLLYHNKEYYNLLPDIQEQIDELVNKYNDYTDEINENTKNILANKKSMAELREEANKLVEQLTGDLMQAKVDEQSAIIDILKSLDEERLKDLEKAAEREIEIIEERYQREIDLLNARKEAYQEGFEEQDYNNALLEIDQKRAQITSQLSSLEGASDQNSIKRRQELLKELENLNKDYNDKVRDYSRDALIGEIEEEINLKEEEKQRKVDLINEELEYQRELIEAKLDNDREYEEESLRIMAMSLEQKQEWYRQNSLEYMNATDIMRESLVSSFTEIANAVTDLIAELERAIAKAEELANKRNSTVRNVGSVAESKPQSYERTIVATVTGPNGGTMYQYDDGSTEFVYVNGKFADGGATQSTGWHWLDGKPGKPERVLSPEQTRVYEDILEEAKRGNVGGKGIVVEQILIQPNEMNNNQDFARAGTTLATSFAEALIGRGIQINQKR